MQIWGFVILAGVAVGAWHYVTATLEDNWRAEQTRLAAEQAGEDERNADELHTEAGEELRAILRAAVESHRLITAMPETQGEPKLCPVDCLLPPRQ